MEKMHSAMKECCMHPDQTHCKGKNKKAHALQNIKIISLLAVADCHVHLRFPDRLNLLIMRT